MNEQDEITEVAQTYVRNERDFYLRASDKEITLSISNGYGSEFTEILDQVHEELKRKNRAAYKSNVLTARLLIGIVTVLLLAGSLVGNVQNVCKTTGVPTANVK